MIDNILTHEKVKRLFDYNSETGDLIRKSRPLSDFKYERHYKTFHIRFANKPVRHIDKDGYYKINYLGKLYSAHRVIFLWMTGRWPSGDIDHKDGNRLNNKWENLREATRTQNNYNSKIHKNNTSGFKGVSKCMRYDAWFARINYDKKIVHLGTYEDLHMAIMARKLASEHLHGDFIRHG